MAMTDTVSPDLKRLLRALKLGQLTSTLPELMPLTECPQGRSLELPTWLTLILLRLVMECHGPCRRVAAVP